MKRKTSGRPVGREWSRTAETRRVLLQAAREVFTEKGFTDASVADVVERAASSVGSLYHHFGGKTELFLALWEQHETEHEARAAEAVATARADGGADPLSVLFAGARVILQGSWERRDLARLFMNDDGPPGFELMRRTRRREWVRQNAQLLGVDDDPVGHMAVLVVTVTIGEASREVAACDTKKEADQIADAAIRLLQRLDPLRPE